MKNNSLTPYINVTKNDIAKGHRHEAFHCPIALASKRVKAFKDNEPAVSRLGIAINGGAVELPEVAKQFIRDFDKKLPVKPFRFKGVFKKYT